MALSPSFSFWKNAYTQGWATNEDLQEAVLWGDITPAEYKLITGEDYTGEIYMSAR